jgi:hypothetical protein
MGRKGELAAAAAATAAGVAERGIGGGKTRNLH